MTKLLKPGLIIFSVLVLLPASLKAQEVDHIYLKNGSVIRGNLMEVEPSDYVKIQDLCGNIWNYPMDRVDKITSEPYAITGFKRDTPGFNQGFVSMTSIGFLAGSSDNIQVAPFSLLMVNGWRGGFGLFAGAGIGIEFLSTNYIPLFLDLRYDLTGNEVVPYLVTKGGYSLPLKSDYTEYEIAYSYSGGPLYAAGIGLKIRTRNHFAWDVEIMYRYQRTSYVEQYEWNNQEYDYSDIYNRIEIRMGFYID